MLYKMNRRRFLINLGLFVALLSGGISLAAPQNAYSLTFSVLSDPQGNSDSWVNALTEVKDSKVNETPEFGDSDFIIIPGDTPPVDVTYSDFTGVFKGAAKTPAYLPVIGNHDADDNGGFPGGMGGMGAGGGGQGGMGMSQGSGGPSGQGGQQGMGGSGGGQPPGGMGQGTGMGGMPASTGDASIIDMDFISNKLIAAIPGVVRMSDKSCTYYYDKENVRIISIDAFSGEAGTGGVITDKGRAWTEKAITSAPGTIDHIFIAFHAPAFPRGRHTNDCFVSNPDQRNAFWKMLISHKDKVRAVFCGHTHSYCRLRVLDPAGTDANDFSKYPDEEGGIYQVNDGSTGMGMTNTFVKVKVDGKNVYFRAFEAQNGKGQAFALKDEWGIINK